MLLRQTLLRSLLLFTLAGSASLAQTPVSADKPAAPEPRRQQSQSQQAQGAPGQTGQAPEAQVPEDKNPKRILDIIPNFQTTNQRPEYVPLTVREKYVLAFHQTVDFSAHFGNLFQAALQQASNGQPHYGQGWGAYAQRFGAAEADQVTSAFFIFGFLPHILKEDPRYFRMGPRSRPLRRIAYAASRTFITRKDSGGNTFNTPQVLGQLLQQSISASTYYPKQDRSVTGALQNWGVNLSYNSAYNVLKEYYPDFLRWTFHRHPKLEDLPPSAKPPVAPAASSSSQQ